MKNLVKFIIETEKNVEGWNGKFYTSKEGQTTIYLDEQKHEVTEMYNACRKSDGYVYASEIEELYRASINPLIKEKIKLMIKKITEQQFAVKKQEVINSLV